MTDQGFIKLHRSILKWEWWEDENTTRVFLWLLLNANWEDLRYRGIEVPKGSLIAGRKRIAKELKISERSVRTSLEHLKSTNEVTIKSTNKFSLITVTNWEKYQGFENEATNKTTTKRSNDRPTTDQQPTTYKEINNIKNYKNYYNSTAQNGRNPDFIAMLEREVKNG